jgi:hypothetical protein
MRSRAAEMMLVNGKRDGGRVTCLILTCGGITGVAGEANELFQSHGISDLLLAQLYI